MLIIAVAVGAGVGVYLWNKPHKNMARAKADLTVTAVELMADFNTDETAANAKYLDKVIAVSGQVQSVNEQNGVTTIILEAEDEMAAIMCELDTLTPTGRTDFAPGETITVKGICAGKTIDIVLVRCVVL